MNGGLMSAAVEVANQAQRDRGIHALVSHVKVNELLAATDA